MEITERPTLKMDINGCGNCKYHKGIPGNFREVWCRRYPPQMIPVLTPQGSRIECRFPMTSPKELCGEWKSKLNVIDNDIQNGIENIAKP